MPQGAHMKNTLRRTIHLLVLPALLLAPLSARAQLEDPEYRDKIDRAIDRGLDYLAACQRPDGTFPDANGTTTALPALAGMAFLSKGYIPGEGRYGQAINRSIDYVLKHADMNEKSRTRGYFGNAGNGRMYAHSISTLFLSEVSGMVDEERQKRINEVLPYAIKVLLDAQAVQKSQQHTGGWRYLPWSNDSDMSCSGWALMALRSARLNGGAVPVKAIDDAVAYVKRHGNPARGCFGYQDQNGYGNTLTGAGILCLELCGRHNDPASLRAARFLMGNFRNLPHEGNCFYGVYYTAQGLFQIGGDNWKTFADWMYSTWIPKQRADGSWDRGENGSPAYQTSLCILAFTVPYRQLPIYQRDETVDEG